MILSSNPQSIKLHMIYSISLQITYKHKIHINWSLLSIIIYIFLLIFVKFWYMFIVYWFNTWTGARHGHLYLPVITCAHLWSAMVIITPLKVPGGHSVDRLCSLKFFDIHEQKVFTGLTYFKSKKGIGTN